MFSLFQGYIPQCAVVQLGIWPVRMVGNCETVGQSWYSPQRSLQVGMCRAVWLLKAWRHWGCCVIVSTLNLGKWN
jgi:hypothetical protein